MHSITSAPTHHPARIRAISLDSPWNWLSSGWLDMCTVPGVSYAYGGLFTSIGFLLLFGLETVDAGYLILPLALGFALVGPMIAVGLYESSRKLDKGGPASLADAFRAFARNPAQIGLVGAFLMIAFIAWLRLAMLEFMLFFGSSPPSLDGLIDSLLTSPQSLPFLALGITSGAFLAVGVFAMSAVAVPMLIDRPETDAMTAMLTSVEAVRRNWKPMMLWAALIAVFTLVGLALFFIGLVLTLPLIGHASWHAYRELVE